MNEKSILYNVRSFTAKLLNIEAIIIFMYNNFAKLKLLINLK